MTRVLLTGAGGFVGHHCLEHIFKTTDWEVVVLDSFQHRGKTDRIREVLDAHQDTDWRERLKVLTHDLTAPISKQLDHEIGPITYAISIASESHVDRSCVEPRPFIENNVRLVLTLLEWMRSRQGWTFDPIRKFLHVSTDEVYGPALGDHNHAEGEPHRPSNPYSASKACQEDIIYSYWRTFDLPVAVSNTMNIIGERQDPEKFVPKVLAAVLRGEKVTIHAGKKVLAPPVGEGEVVGLPASEWTPGSRFYLHARNQADALLFLLQNVPFTRYSDPSRGVTYAAEPAFMPRFNVVGEQEIDNLEMARLIAQIAGKPLDWEMTDFHSSRPGHDLRYALDGRFLAALGWTPPYSLEESLEKTIRWTMDHPHWLLDAEPAVA